MDPKTKKFIIVFLLISISILTGAFIAPSFLNWGIEKTLPVYNSDSDMPLKYNQYMINGEYITRDESTAWITTESGLLVIDINSQQEKRGYKICRHNKGDKIKYAVFVVGDWSWQTFILRRELC